MGKYKENLFTVSHYELDNERKTHRAKLACWPTMSLTHVALWISLKQASIKPLPQTSRETQ